MNKWLIILILLTSGVLGFSLSIYLHDKNSDDKSEVQMIQTFHSPAIFVKQLAGDPDAGRKIFKEFCSACHSKQPVIDIHAPTIGDKHAWQPLKNLGVDTLLNITTEGVGAMPARGGCFECSDEQLRQTIQYILHSS